MYALLMATKAGYQKLVLKKFRVLAKILDDEYLISIFPKLNWVWENFYDGPIINPETANDLVHELILLKKLF